MPPSYVSLLRYRDSVMVWPDGSSVEPEILLMVFQSAVFKACMLAVRPNLHMVASQDIG